MAEVRQPRLARRGFVVVVMTLPPALLVVCELLAASHGGDVGQLRRDRLVAVLQLLSE